MDDIETIDTTLEAEAAGDEPTSAESEEQTETQEEQPQEQPQEDEGAKRLARLAHEAREAKKLARQLKTELDALKEGRPAEPTDAEMERKIEERAKQKAAEKEFVDMCNTIYDQGVKDFGKREWDDTIKALQDQTGTNIPYAIVEAANEAGNAHKIFKYLADNPDIYDDLLHVGVHRMGAKLAKLSSKLEAPTKQVSKAPPPIKPVAGATKAEPNWETMPIEEYMKLRDQQELKRRGRL